VVVHPWSVSMCRPLRTTQVHSPQESCISTLCVTVPVDSSHSFHDLSAPAVASAAPSLEIATSKTLPNDRVFSPDAEIAHFSEDENVNATVRNTSGGFYCFLRTPGAQASHGAPAPSKPPPAAHPARSMSPAPASLPFYQVL
jgi:hypothetical protein